MQTPVFICALLTAFAPAKFERIEITDTAFHLGDSEKKSWKGITTVKPHHRRRLELDFSARANDTEHVIRVRSGEVSDTWNLRLNGKSIGKLEKTKSESNQVLEIAPGMLKSGANTLTVENEEKGTDDIWVGPITLETRSLASALNLAVVKVRVRDAIDSAALPCRITVTRIRRSSTTGKWKEELIDLDIEKHSRIAMRKSVVYTLDGALDLRLKAGRYRVYATRGFEYGLGRVDLELNGDETRDIDITLEREVDTTGYVAGDTHVHTLTYSKHGDATIEERVVTIAGEGVEVAIATDHNHHTDYRPVEKTVGVVGRYRSIIGNEFTTSSGHFNAFPIDAKAKPANHKHKGWVELIKGLRKTPGVRVVIANHPRRPSFDKGPWGAMKVHPVSGELPDELSGEDPWIGLDAVEVLNGKGLLKRPALNFTDWFALLNHGHRLAAVAGSDSHTVDQPIGQCRTYIASETDDPDKIDVAKVVDSFLAGRLLVSMGLLAKVRVDGKFVVGDLATGLGEEMAVEVEVQAPRWIAANRVDIYLNGEKIRSEKIEHAADDVVKYRKTLMFSTPHRDAHLVVVATGPALEVKYWTYGENERYVIGATNPVWIDGDGDGKFTSARGYAERLVDEHGIEGRKLREALSTYDEAVAVQTASLVRRRLEVALQKLYDQLQAQADGELREIFPEPTNGVDRGVDEYLGDAPPIDVITVRERRESEKAAAAAKKKAKRKAKKK